MAYQVNEIFWSPQGEGIRAGEMSMFIRLSGCNMRCEEEAGPKSPGGFDCDTEFVSGRKMSADEIVEESIMLVEQGGVAPTYWSRCKPWCIFTGGEPGIQLDKALVDAMQDGGFLCAIETNGSIDVSELGLDWITVSPKVAEHAVRQMTADEVKYVRGHGQGIPRPRCKAEYQLISPAFNGLTLDSRAVAWCNQLIRENPDWRLSVQHHKIWGLR
tara:strand:+ start:74 stop:718 length:645 start_codon:yes stop_codon:yes gene_type:complete